jgi:hypothetical protein
MPEKIGRRQFEVPVEGDVPDVPLWFKNVMNQLQNDAETGQGKLSERPVAGTRGRLYYVTEGAEKGLWWDTGAEWIRTTINQAPTYESPGGESGKPSASRPSLVYITAIAKPQTVGSRVAILVSVKRNGTQIEEIGTEASRTSSVTGYGTATFPLYLGPGDEWSYSAIVQKEGSGGGLVEVKEVIL